MIAFFQFSPSRMLPVLLLSCPNDTVVAGHPTPIFFHLLKCRWFCCFHISYPYRCCWPCNADLGKRTGNGVSPQLCDTLERVCVDAEALLGKEQAQRRVAITQAALDEKMDNIRGAVTMGE